MFVVSLFLLLVFSLPVSQTGPYVAVSAGFDSATNLTSISADWNFEASDLLLFRCAPSCQIVDQVALAPGARLYNSSRPEDCSAAPSYFVQVSNQVSAFAAPCPAAPSPSPVSEQLLTDIRELQKNNFLLQLVVGAVSVGLLSLLFLRVRI